MKIFYHVPGIPGTFTNLPDILRLAGLDKRDEIRGFMMFTRQTEKGETGITVNFKPSKRALNKAERKL